MIRGKRSTEDTKWTYRFRSTLRATRWSGGGGFRVRTHSKLPEPPGLPIRSAILASPKYRGQPRGI